MLAVVQPTVGESSINLGSGGVLHENRASLQYWASYGAAHPFREGGPLLAVPKCKSVLTATQVSDAVCCCILGFLPSCERLSKKGTSCSI
jgi:hypothetical protein